MDDTTTHEQNRDEVFGRDAPRDAAGQPLEKGVGSKWAAMHPADKALFHAAETRDLAETLLAQAKTLTDTAEKFLAAHKSLITAAGDSARDKPDMTPAEVADWRRTHPRGADESMPSGLTAAQQDEWNRTHPVAQNQQRFPLFGQQKTEAEIAEEAARERSRRGQVQQHPFQQQP